ncbi:MAG TPA: hypothetical protein VIN67_07935 [Desulfobaccales bacterium]
MQTEAAGETPALWVKILFNPYPRIFFHLGPSLQRIIDDVLRLIPKFLFIPDDSIKIFFLPDWHRWHLPAGFLLKFMSGERFPGMKDTLNLIVC